MRTVYNMIHYFIICQAPGALEMVQIFPTFHPFTDSAHAIWLLWPTFVWDGPPPHSSPFLECSNLSDMTSDKPGSECCIIIHDLRPSKPVDQHNSASLCKQCIPWYTISLSIRHLGHLKWFSYFQRFTHLPTPHMPYEYFDSHCFFQIGRLFSACCNPDM